MGLFSAIFYYNIFNLKMVEILLRADHYNVEVVIAQIRKHRILSIFFAVFYATSSSVFAIFHEYTRNSGGEETLEELFEGSRQFLVFWYSACVLFILSYAFLFVYFWKMTSSYADLL